MDRRGFLRGLVGGIAITAAEPSWPYRVYSFAKSIILPSQLTIAEIEETYLAVHDINAITAKYIIPSLADTIFKPSPTFWHLANPPYKSSKLR